MSRDYVKKIQVIESRRVTDGAHNQESDVTAFDVYYVGFTREGYFPTA